MQRTDTYIPIFLILAIGCGSETTDPIPGGDSPSPAEISLDLARDTAASLREVVEATVTVRDQNRRVMDGVEVSIESSDSRIATVLESGIRANRNGSAWIVARVGDLVDSTEFHVLQVPATVDISLPIDTTWALGRRLRTTISVSDAAGFAVEPGIEPLVFISSDSTIATVDSAGIITPLAEGSIRISAVAGPATGFCELEIVDLAANDLALDIAEELQWALEDTVTARDVRGGAAAVFVPGEGMWTGSFGISRPTESLRPDMSFPFASITKTAVGAVVMLLAEEGAINLQDTVGQWFDSLPNVSTGIKVEELLKHEAGLFDFVNHPNISAAQSAEPDRIWTPVELMENFVGVPVFAHGTSFGYSNTNFHLLGMIYEAVAGETLAEGMRSRLWTPLDLPSFYLPSEETARGNLSGGFGDALGTGALVDVSPFVTPSTHSMRWAAGGLISRLDDLALWAVRAFGDELFDPATLDQITAFDNFQSGGWSATGLGLLQYTLLGRELWGHAGAVFGFTSLLVYDPATGVAIATVVNQDVSTHQLAQFGITNGLLRKVLDHLGA